MVADGWILGLRGKVAAITGAARGIGRAVAELFARAGARVCLLDRDGEGVTRIASYLRDVCGAEAIGVSVNVSCAAQVADAVGECVEWAGGLDVLVNSAGVISTTGIFEVTDEEWDRVLSVNLKGVYFCCCAAAKVMAPRGSGAIVNVASVAGKTGGGVFGNCAYAASKAGVIALTKAFARELASAGVRVNAVAPAATDTEMIHGFSGLARERYLQRVPMGRLAKPDEVAVAVLFLASPLASYITGEVLDVNGGFLMD